MATSEFYEDVRRAHREAVRTGRFEPVSAENRDPNSPSRGYVLRIDVSQLVPQYDQLVSRFRGWDPNQYYFPKSDLHITVLEFVSARPDFRAYEPQIAQFDSVCRRVLANRGGFDIALRGTVFTKTSGIIAGFDGDELIRIREDLRRELRRRGLQPLERYESRSAHVSFLALQKPSASHERFLALVDATKELDLGVVRVGEMELVEQDWFSRASTRRLLGRYQLEGRRAL